MSPSRDYREYSNDTQIYYQACLNLRQRYYSNLKRRLFYDRLAFHLAQRMGA